VVPRRDAERSAEILPGTLGNRCEATRERFLFLVVVDQKVVRRKDAEAER
jgi:hypothetical protein